MLLPPACLYVPKEVLRQQKLTFQAPVRFALAAMGDPIVLPFNTYKCVCCHML